MDAARRIDLLQAQITEAADGEPADFEGWRERTRAALRVALGEAHPALERFDQVRYGLSFWTDSTPDSAWVEARSDGVKRGIAILEGAIHEIRSSEPHSPSVEVNGLHPWVAGAAAGLWDDGHYRQAVDEATRAIEVRLRSRLRVDLSGTNLVTEAFNPAPPKPNRPRLRFPEFEDGTQAWTNAHQGTMHFAQGCMLRIRNLVEHYDTELDKQVALESLAALSLLARWIDGSSIDRLAEE